MGDSDGNNNGADAQWIDTLTLAFNRRTFELTFGGHVLNYDQALCMLEMAHRHFEGLLRTAEVGKVLNAPLGANLPRLPGRRQ